MAVVSRLLPLMAASTFAVFLLVLLATPTNALSGEHHAHVARGHDSIAKRKRNPVKRAKRCRPKSSSAPAPAAPSSSAPKSTEPAPAASSSPAPSPSAYTPPPPPNTGGGGGGLDPNKKLLLAWPNGKWDMAKWQGSKNVGGVYSWSPDDPTDKSGYNFFPMMWGFNQKSSFSKVDYSKYKLCFGQNEPNQVGQSDMSVADGVKLWKSTMEPAGAQGCKLVSPATTSAPSGKKWMQDFMAACTGCNVHYIALHWYDVSIEAFKAYVEDFHTTFGKPVIVSEYACQNFNGGAQCTKDQTWAFHTEMIKWFKQTPYVAMYAPFGAMREMQGVNPDNQLMNNDGTPNALGKMYLWG